jgi:hypothetical protein
MSHLELFDTDDLQELASDFEELTRSTVSSDADSFQLRQVLRFIDKILHVLGESFESVYGILVDITYITEDDVQRNRHLSLKKELDMVVAKSHFRDSSEICSRLRYLRETYDSSIAPIIHAQGLDVGSWSSIFGLLDEYEGAIIGSINHSVFELRGLLDQADVGDLSQLHSVAKRRSEVLRENLDRLRDLSSQILGASGREGLLALTATNRDGLSQIFISRYVDQRNSDQRRGAFMGDTFSNIQNSTIVSRSLVEQAFNSAKVTAGAEAAEALRKIAEFVAASGNKEAGELLDQFNEELARPEPRKSLLKRSWESLVQVLPTVTAVAGAAGAIAKLFA